MYVLHAVVQDRFPIVATNVIFPELSSATCTVVTSGPSPLSPLESVNVTEASVDAAWLEDARPITGQTIAVATAAAATATIAMTLGNLAMTPATMVAAVSAACCLVSARGAAPCPL